MILTSCLALLLISISKPGVEALSSSIIKRIVVDITTDFQCTFELSYTETEVDLWESFATCSPDEPTDVTNIEVKLSASNGYEFTGLININPTEIVSMTIDNAIAPEPSADSDSGPEEVEFKEIYSNVTAEELPDNRHYCGIDPIMEVQLGG